MPDETLNGANFHAVTRLSNGDDTITYAEVGDTCERVPVGSLAALLAHGYIARTDDAARPVLDVDAARLSLEVEPPPDDEEH